MEIELSGVIGFMLPVILKKFIEDGAVLASHPEPMFLSEKHHSEIMELAQQIGDKMFGKMDELRDEQEDIFTLIRKMKAESKLDEDDLLSMLFNNDLN